jgi:hypothetical protein
VCFYCKLTVVYITVFSDEITVTKLKIDFAMGDGFRDTNCVPPGLLLESITEEICGTWPRVPPLYCTAVE